MSIRKFLNESPAIAIGAVVVVLAICVWVIWGHVTPSGNRPARAGYFTVDDGKTWFEDDLSKLPPFDHEGKQAVRVHLFRCASSNDKIVGYLERFTAKGKAAIEKKNAEEKANPGRMPMAAGEVAALGRAITEVKKPGDANWAVNGSVEATKIQNVTCPDGSPALVDIVQ